MQYAIWIIYNRIHSITNITNTIITALLSNVCAVQGFDIYRINQNKPPKVIGGYGKQSHILEIVMVLLSSFWVLKIEMTQKLNKIIKMEDKFNIKTASFNETKSSKLKSALSIQLILWGFSYKEREERGSISCVCYRISMSCNICQTKCCCFFSSLPWPLLRWVSWFISPSEITSGKMNSIK